MSTDEAVHDVNTRNFTGSTCKYFFALFFIFIGAMAVVIDLAQLASINVDTLDNSFTRYFTATVWAVFMVWLFRFRLKSNSEKK